jgi:nucleoside-diphosphate-sugar epimerase
MIYIDDCVDATMKLLRADAKNLTRCTYNLAGISFTPSEFADAVKKLIPGSIVKFEPDFRQKIAETWPKSLDDSDS